MNPYHTPFSNFPFLSTIATDKVHERATSHSQFEVYTKPNKSQGIFTLLTSAFGNISRQGV